MPSPLSCFILFYCFLSLISQNSERCIFSVEKDWSSWFNLTIEYNDIVNKSAMHCNPLEIGQTAFLDIIQLFKTHCDQAQSVYVFLCKIKDDRHLKPNGLRVNITTKYNRQPIIGHEYPNCWCRGA